MFPADLTSPRQGLTTGPSCSLAPEGSVARPGWTLFDGLPASGDDVQERYLADTAVLNPNPHFGGWLAPTRAENIAREVT